MRKVIDSEDGKMLYSKRMHTIEPVFGNICSNKRLNKLSLRGENKVTAQWQLYCMVHNVEICGISTQIGALAVENP